MPQRSSTETRPSDTQELTAEDHPRAILGSVRRSCHPPLSHRSALISPAARLGATTESNRGNLENDDAPPIASIPHPGCQPLPPPAYSKGQHGSECNQAQHPMGPAKSTSAEFLDHDRVQEKTNSFHPALRIDQEKQASKKLAKSRAVLCHDTRGPPLVERCVSQPPHGGNRGAQTHQERQNQISRNSAPSFSESMRSLTPLWPRISSTGGIGEITI